MTDPTASGYNAASQPAVAPGWYPDANGQQRWWDGTAWTDHVAGPVAPQPAYGSGLGADERPQLPAGTRTGTAWVWVVALATFVSLLPLFFFDFSGYIEATVNAELSGDDAAVVAVVGQFFGFFIVSWLIGLLTYVATIVGALLDAKQLAARGVERPFHWAFAFIPIPLVYLIGRHVVLRKVGSSGAAPMWTHIGLYIATFIVTMIWSFAVTFSAMDSVLGNPGFYPGG